MKIDCDRCGDEMTQPGAIVLGPPDLFPARTVEKLHVCRSCWPSVRASVMHFAAGLVRSNTGLPEGQRAAE